jgi:hypothetical protein
MTPSSNIFKVTNTFGGWNLTFDWKCVGGWLSHSDNRVLLEELLRVLSREMWHASPHAPRVGSCKYKKVRRNIEKVRN